MDWKRTLPAALALLASLGCARHSSVDRPLGRWTPELDAKAFHQVVGDRAPELVVLLAFSGGGTRAAAFAYGVLQELADTEVMTSQGNRRLIQEIDAISSVSGGSFTSTYFALHGEGIFHDFEERFLRQNVEGALIGELFKPTNWFRMMSGKYGRGDLAARYYSKQVFDGATFAAVDRPEAPFLVINTTDLGTGVRFPMVQPFFSLICADHAGYPVSRAVAASSAVPGVFNPITLESFAGTCDHENPAWLRDALANKASSTHHEAEQIAAYLDKDERPWIHLVDGGISDNLGLRSFYDLVGLKGGLEEAFSGGGARPTRFLVISVDAHTDQRPRWTLYNDAPSLFEVLAAVSDVQILRYDVDTIQIVRDSFRRWTQADGSSFHFIRVDFHAIEDQQERDFLDGIGTSFHLKDAEVDALISGARKILRESPDFQDFVQRSQGSAR
jgi:NTE family protein